MRYREDVVVDKIHLLYVLNRLGNLGKRKRRKCLVCFGNISKLDR